MQESRPSRRTLLTAGGMLVGGVLGISGWEAVRALTDRATARPAEPEKKPFAVKSVIDTHVHLISTKLPGVPLKSTPEGAPLDETPEQILAAIQPEMRAAGVTHVLAMPRRDLNDKDPLGVTAIQRLSARLPSIHAVGFADPERFDDAHMERVEECLKRGDVVALKAYLGYLHHGPDSVGYRPYYRLAAKYKIPVIFHTGDTYSHRAKLKFAHPLLVDEIAVDYPETNFVIAHCGNPWLIDAAEVIYKNNKVGRKENVWADLSGILVGSAADFATYRKQGVLKTVQAEVRKAFDYAERPDRFLYASDWSLVPMLIYRDFIAELIPEAAHQAVFHDNAQALFKLR